MMSDGNELINTTSFPTGGYEAAREGYQASSYFNLVPYPLFAFGPLQWPLDKGPIPTALPYARLLTEECAEFVFQGGPPTFCVPDCPNAQEWLQTVIKENRLESRYISLAVRAGIHGTIAAKYSYLPDSNRPVRITFLSVPEECRVWMDPHDQTRILMARIQYPYRSNADNSWYYFREEWTADYWVTYQPKRAGNAGYMSSLALPGYTESFGDGDGFVIDKQEPNPFGLVPVMLIKNKCVEGLPHGIGDCWSSFRLMDRIALTMHGEDRSNQMHSEPNLVLKNSTVNNTSPLAPGEPLIVTNSDPTAPPADAMLLEPTGAAREWVYKSIDKWEELLYKQVGLSRVDPATIGNKGNITRLALLTAYARTVATCTRKRTLWGEAGLSLFFADMLVGLSRCGDFAELRAIGDMVDVSCAWQDFFAPTDDDKNNLTTRTIQQTNAGLLPQNRAVQRVATSEGVPNEEIDNIVAEIAEEKRIKQEAAKRAVPVGNTGDGEDGANEEFAEIIDSSGNDGG